MIISKKSFQSAHFSNIPFRGIGGLFIFLFSGFTLMAQDTILNRNVSVEREYRPVIQDAGKINSIPQVLEPKVEKNPAVYSDFNLPLNADYNIHTLPAAELIPDRSTDKKAYARIGFGTYLNSLLDAAFPLINQPGMLLNATLSHNGTLEAKRFHTTTKADISFEKLFKDFSIYAGVNGSHEYLKYYGNSFNLESQIDPFSYAALNSTPTYTEINRAGINTSGRTFIPYEFLLSADNTFWRLNAMLGLSSLPLAKDIRYRAEVKYNLFSDVNGLNENLIHSMARFSSPSNENRLGIDMDLFNLFYNSTAIPAFNFWNSYSVLNLNPYYSLEREQWNVRLGVKSAFAFVHGDGFNPSADVSGEWKPFPKWLSVYGGVKGDYEINSQTKIFAENPFLYSDLRVKDTYTPYDFYAGVKLKPLYNLLFNAYVDFRQINNQYFFTNKEYKLANASPAMPVADSSLFTNRFNVIYSNATLFRAGARLSYTLQDIVNVELKAAYNGWNVTGEQHAWYKPTYEAQLNATGKIDKHFSLSLDGFYEGGRWAKLGTKSVAMNDKLDLNLGIHYRYDKQFGAFLKANNLINSQYQDFYGYDVQGINFMIGGSVTF